MDCLLSLSFLQFDEAHFQNVIVSGNEKKLAPEEELRPRGRSKMACRKRCDSCTVRHDHPCYSSSSKADTGKLSDNPVPVLKVIFSVEGSSTRISTTESHSSSSLVFTPSSSASCASPRRPSPQGRTTPPA
ncbi:hypothetical protein MUK42_33149 [Musa troglodytarum]|uniref:Uncharacterized protein n=1 Tax=Musa troglodytarum TaxID=320322 RepID=A0A9E7KIL5_9LILI|nr:hypothetical protein MUK42_33149 [Musa troglodytarum]